MEKMKKSMLLVVLCTLAWSGASFAMTTTPMDAGGKTAEDLAQALVGAGVEISNVSYTGGNAASGYFTGGTAAGIGIEKGIVLTSGFVSNLNGTSNTSSGITGVNSQPGDANLNALIPGYTTHDAAVLQFDFKPLTASTIFFQYVFGSDEYNEWVHTSFNDVFGFFFDGANIALIPGTTTAVSINNINLGDNSLYYNNNGPGPYPFEYDGFTDPFTATISGLTAGQTYHIKLAIADAGDYILDSGVFLKAESFGDKPPEGKTPEPATMLLLGSGLLGLWPLRKKIMK